MTDQQPFFSIVMASYLGEYSGQYGNCATDRETKFLRAIQSVYEQTFLDWELIIVADGCETTWSHKDDFEDDQRVRFLKVPKQRLWSDKVRNAGISKARGRYILYLDTDDQFVSTHLHGIHENLERECFPTWAIMNDLVFCPPDGPWQIRVASMDRPRGAGTSQIVHHRSLYWPEIQFRGPAMGYDHDEQFFRHLKRSAKGETLGHGCGGYMVCHIPREYDI